MEGLSPHLPRSHAFNLVPLCSLRFFFLVLTITISISCLASSGAVCEEPFPCGKNLFGYPFGRTNSGCGDPALQLDCDDEMPLLNIGSFQYYVLQHFPQHDFSGYINITIVEKNAWGQDRCNPLSTAQFWSNPKFHIGDGYENFTLWTDCGKENANLLEKATKLKCNNDWYYNMSLDLSWTPLCKLPVQVPVNISDIRALWLNPSVILREGFQIRWSVTVRCKDWASSGGLCGYNSSTEFYCNCNGTVHPDKCPAGNRPPPSELPNIQKSGTKPKTTKISTGVAIGTVALLHIGVLLVIVYRKRLFSSSSSKELQLSNVEKFLQDYVHHQLPSRYSYPQLKKITNNFRDKIGEGGFGVVYKGKLPTGNLVAVKMLDRSRHSENQFINEVATIGRIHHVHLVRLMGYCYEGITSALVYEYMPNGSLEKFVFAERDRKEILNWEQLYSIALGAARGIAYLHQDCDRRIIHFDIKPHNILLDAYFTPKVADFGLAKLCGKQDDHISMTAARGTPGYAAPELWSRNLGPVTDKSDVYSFGMVLLEIVGGRKNIDVQVSRSSQIYFPEWAFKLLEKGELEMRLRGSEKAELDCEEEKKAIRLAKVGLWCIQYNSTDRPCMSRVVQMLEGNGNDVTNPPQPFKPTIGPAPSIYSTEESSSQ